MTLTILNIANKIIKNRTTNYIIPTLPDYSFCAMFCEKQREIQVAIHILQTAISVVGTVLHGQNSENKRPFYYFIFLKIRVILAWGEALWLETNLSKCTKLYAKLVT